MKVIYVIEQSVIFDGEPHFAVSASALMELLNHEGYALNEIDDAKEEFDNPTKYKIQVAVSAQKIE